MLGKKIRVVKSKNKSLEKIRGIVLDETKNMIIIEDKGKQVMVEKKTCEFEIDGEKKQGKKIVGKIKDRIKKNKKVRKRW